MIPYKLGVISIDENRMEISFSMKGVTFHNDILGRWTEPAFRVESMLRHGLLMEKNVARRPDKPLLYHLLTIEGVLCIELKKKSFIVEKRHGTEWAPLLEEVAYETLNFLHNKTLTRKKVPT